MCYLAAEHGAREFAKLISSTNPSPNAILYAGTKLPNPNNFSAADFDASIKVKEYLSILKSKKFEELITRLFVIDIYIEWNEVRRPKIAKEFGLKINNVKADLMDDVRKIRNLIVHKRWKGKTLGVLHWEIDPVTFHVTPEMFKELIWRIRQMKVTVPLGAKEKE